MANYRFSAKVVSRGGGQSVIAKAAYNHRTKLRDERTGELKDYSRAGGVLFSGIFTPKDAPAWTRDREQLWNAVERREDASTRPKEAQLARDIELSLPHELTNQQRQQLVTDFVREQFARKGMIVDVAIHSPGKNSDPRNYHAHLLVTMREIGPDGFGKKVREWNSRQQLEHWREEWEKIQNRYLERHGHEARVDRRTLEAQGIDREATTHRGPHVDAMERKGVPTERGLAARETFYGNREVAKLKRELAGVQRQIAEMEHGQHRVRPTETRTGAKDNYQDATRQNTARERQKIDRTLDTIRAQKSIRHERFRPANDNRLSLPRIPKVPLRATAKALDATAKLVEGIFTFFEPASAPKTPEQIEAQERQLEKQRKREERLEWEREHHRKQFDRDR